jgi:alkylhydroperoxidase family enzyme
MARVRSIPPNELPADLAAIYERFSGQYGPFRNQVAVFAHVPAALRHLMAMLIELREAATLPKRLLELAILTVSKLNACD